MGRAFEYRPNQKETIEAALSAFHADKSVVLIEGPTGIGKSLVNVLVAETFPSAYYASPQVALVDQVVEDPLLRDSVRGLYGKPNYPCVLPGVEKGVTVDAAPCERGHACVACGGKGQVSGTLDGERPPGHFDERGMLRLPGSQVSAAAAPCPECQGKGARSFECHLKRAQQDDDGKIVGPPACPYYAAKFAAARGRIAVMTMAYFLLASTPATEPRDQWGLVKGRFPPRALLVIDEAHAAAELASDFISLTLSPHRLRTEAWRETWAGARADALRVRDEAGAAAFLRDVLLPELRRDRDLLTALVRPSEPGGARPVVQVIEECSPVDRARAYRDLSALESLILSAELALEDLKAGNPWAVDARPVEDKLVLEPVVVGPFLRRRLWNRAERVLLTTATVLDPRLFVRELGLDDRSVAYHRVPSTFPPERAPVIDVAVGPLTRKGRAATLPKALARLCEILDAEKERGIVHCHSYENAAYIRDHVPDGYRGRLVFHEGKDRGDVLDAWLHDGRPDSVLVSVAMTEGLDLHGDLARFAVIWKVPYPDLGDKRVQRRVRMRDGDHWYEMETLKAVIQASGRIVRSETDHGRVYVLDSEFRRLVREASRWVPDWFRARLEVGRRQPLPGFDAKSGTVDSGRIRTPNV